MSIAKITDVWKKAIDRTTNARTTIEYPHHETHAGKRFYVMYSVASLGAMTTPNDLITLDFTTSDSTTWDHLIFLCKGSSGFRVRLIEAPTGGAASPTGQINILNHNRNSLTASVTTNGTTAGIVNYDSTQATGGITLWDDYIEGSTSGITGSGAIANRDELELKQNTKYQISIYGTATEPASIYLDWYEHADIV